MSGDEANKDVGERDGKADGDVTVEAGTDRASVVTGSVSCISGGDEVIREVDAPQELALEAQARADSVSEREDVLVRGGAAARARTARGRRGQARRRGGRALARRLAVVEVVLEVRAAGGRGADVGRAGVLRGRGGDGDGARMGRGRREGETLEVGQLVDRKAVMEEAPVVRRQDLRGYKSVNHTELKLILRRAHLAPWLSLYVMVDSSVESKSKRAAVYACSLTECCRDKACPGLPGLGPDTAETPWAHRGSSRAHCRARRSPCCQAAHATRAHSPGWCYFRRARRAPPSARARKRQLRRARSRPDVQRAGEVDEERAGHIIFKKYEGNRLLCIETVEDEGDNIHSVVLGLVPHNALPSPSSSSAARTSRIASHSHIKGLGLSPEGLAATDAASERSGVDLVKTRRFSCRALLPARAPCTGKRPSHSPSRTNLVRRQRHRAAARARRAPRRAALRRRRARGCPQAREEARARRSRLRDRLTRGPGAGAFGGSYVLLSENPPVFAPLPYPSSARPPLAEFQLPSGRAALGLTASDIPSLLSLYGKNEFHIPIPAFGALFSEHATAPFVFQIFCVALWCLGEYWYYSIFALFMLIMFECTVVWQRVRTLTEFRSMSIEPYPIHRFRDGSWTVIQSDELLPGDVVSAARRQSLNEGTTVRADLLLLRGTCIVSEAMLSGESTPLLKESIELFECAERLDVDVARKNRVLFSGTKALQSSSSSANGNASTGGPTTPDNGCLAAVLRTGFGTAPGSLVRTMLFSSERVSANTLESFLFIAFLLVFALAASGFACGLKTSELLLDCVMIVTSVVSPELPMELSLAVNVSLVALQKHAVFCTEPFRVPFADRVEVCAFDKTGTITAEIFVVEGALRAASRETALCLVAAHALVRLDDGMIVGDPMEKVALEALGCYLLGTASLPTAAPPYQFFSALKRMATVATVQKGPGSGQALVSVKGAPETIKTMLARVSKEYDETYKYFTRRGSCVLALAGKEMDGTGNNKEDTVETPKMLAESSHRCIMITGDNPLADVHVARDVEIVDREAFILDLKENPGHEADLEWRTVDETKFIHVDPSAPFDQTLLCEYDICITGAALKQYEYRPTWLTLVQHTWVYARVSPAQKGLILTTLKSLGYVTLMTDVARTTSARSNMHMSVSRCSTARWTTSRRSQSTSASNTSRRPPPPVPPTLASAFPEIVEAQVKSAAAQATKSYGKNMDAEDDVPKIKLGDASCAAPFTSKLSNVNSRPLHACRDGADVQDSRAELSDLCVRAERAILDGIKYDDYQVMITGMLMPVCFLCVSRAKLAIHIASLVYITTLSNASEECGPIDLEAKFEPNLLNTAIYLLGLSQQVSTFAIRFQDQPLRESIRENPAPYWGLVGLVIDGWWDFELKEQCQLAKAVEQDPEMAVKKGK
ncbi:E1-E2 ATPase-domain-containing protein [Phellopilus nigrolimitatus]|nr:E1-E2 ATPase-domain-containing protein [Phellopilus nigrolimitatus]